MLPVTSTQKTMSTAQLSPRAAGGGVERLVCSAAGEPAGASGCSPAAPGSTTVSALAAGAGSPAAGALAAASAGVSAEPGVASVIVTPMSRVQVPQSIPKRRETI